MNRKDVVYIGIFVPHIDGKLEQDITNQHVTLSFAPDEEKFRKLLQYLGKKVKIEVLGYGNDEKNEGLSVNILEDIPYFGAEQKHITLSIHPESSAVKTGFIEFGSKIPEDIMSQLPQNMIIEGKIAVFTKDKTLVFDANEFDEIKIFDSEIADDVLGNNDINCETTSLENHSHLKQVEFLPPKENGR